jgi:hypothetical protein
MSIRPRRCDQRWARAWPPAKLGQPLGGNDANDVGEARQPATAPLLHRDEADPARLPDRILGRGAAHARPGRDGVDVKAAAAALPPAPNVVRFAITNFWRDGRWKAV